MSLSRILRLLPPIPWYRLFVRPFLFRLAPEPAQRVAESTMALRPIWRAVRPSPPDLPSDLAGIPLRNPLGLAAGLDKQCAYLDVLGGLGFGYVIGGTVKREPWPGNPKPRVLRVPERTSLINALGFPSVGLDVVVKELRGLRDRPARVLVSIAVLDDDETLECLTTLEPLVDGIELNISSPNTAGLRKYQEPEALRTVLEKLNAKRQKPLFIKLPPYVNDEQRDGVLSLVRVCAEVGVSGVTAINTIPVEDDRLAMGRGGLSGAAILPDMLRIVPEIRREIGSGLTLNACGGIASADDAAAALDAGADTVQLYSALVYQGPGLVERIVRGLADRSGRRGSA